MTWLSTPTVVTLKTCIERIYFDPIYWNALKQKLLDFCLFAIVPEILTGRIKNGKHLYPRLFSYK